MSHNKSDLIFQKEKEWRDLIISELDESKINRDYLQKENEELKHKFNQLKSDFSHNLRLLNEREDDLGYIEKENESLRSSLCVYEERISELSVEIARLKDESVRGEKLTKEMKDKIDEMREKCIMDIRSVKEEKIREVNKVRKEVDERVRGLERALIEADERRKEESREREGLEEAREEESRKERDSSHWKVIQEEMKYRLVSKELEMCRVNKAELVVQLTEKEELIRVLELRINECELANASEVSIMRMKIEQNIVEAREMQSRFEKEIDRLTRKLQAREDTMKAKVTMAKKLETELRTVLDDASSKEYTLKKEIDCINEELVKERDALFEEKKISDGKDLEINRLVFKMNDEVAHKDGELRNMKIEVDSLRQNLRGKQEELLELRNELEYAVGRDIEETKRKEFDNQKLESELQKVRVEEMSKVEGMIKTITKTRDDALADIRHLKKQFDERKEVRICAQCSINGSNEIEPSNETKDQMKQLQMQNNQLKEVISRMTEETTKELKNISTIAPSNNKHIATLAERNRQLQQEKIDLLAVSRKVQARFEGMETENCDLKRIVRERETEISQIKFELDSLKRHSGLDTRTLRRRAQELETELEMSRKEAGEYYKGNLELGRVVEDLQAELTFLKSEDFGQVPSLNFGAQEMIIEQLKKELSDLRSKLSVNVGEFSSFEINECTNKDESREMKMIRTKLKMAANQIKNMATEKQVLIQLSNRLRSELKQAGIKITSYGTSVRQTSEYDEDGNTRKNVRHTMNDLENKLSQLENLQRNARNNYNDSKVKSKSPRDEVSSVGGTSVEEVFKLLDDSDSLGKSSVYGPDGNIQVILSPNELWGKSVRLNPPKINSKRNMVSNRR